MSTANRRPRTPAQQAASRQNGAKSRGPVTDIGKQRSRMNALTHGLCAQSVLLPDEDESECQQLIDEHEQHYRPVTSLELARVREMALCDWRLRRCTEIERGLFTLALTDAAEVRERYYQNLDTGEAQAHAWRYSLAGAASLPLLLRYQAQLQRTQERARKALKQLQAERQQQEPSALSNEPKPNVISSATQPNEPKPVTPIRSTPPILEPPQPTPSSTPNEPKQAPAPVATKLPNEPKLTRQQRRWAERQRNHEHKQS